MIKNKFLSKENLRGLLGVLIALLLSVAVYISKDYLLGFKNLGYFGLFITSLLTNATVFVPIPYIPVVIVSASILNPIMVSFVVGLGSAIGELTGYLAGASGSVVVKGNEKFQKVEKYMSKYGVWTIFFLSVVPNFIFDVAGIISGATRVPVIKFLFAAWAGKFVRYLLISGAGNYWF